MNETTVRTETLNLPGGQVVRVSLYGGDSSTVVLSRGFEDGAAVAGLDGDSVLTIPGSALGELVEALRELEGEE